MRPRGLRRCPGRPGGGGGRLPPGGDPERTAVGRRAAGLARERADGDAERARGARQAGVRRVVFAASSSAYGDTEELPKHEDMLPNPLSPYAAGKLAGEYYVQVYARTMGLDGVSLRYFNVFGPRQDPSSPYSGVISLFTAHGARGDGRSSSATAGRRATSRTSQTSSPPICSPPTPRTRWAAWRLNVGTGRRISLIELVAGLNEIRQLAWSPTSPPARATSATLRPI